MRSRRPDETLQLDSDRLVAMDAAEEPPLVAASQWMTTDTALEPCYGAGVLATRPDC